MFGKAIPDSMRSAAKRFARADQGNIAMIFAITLVPLLAIVGAAVDYTRASAARSAMTERIPKLSAFMMRLPSTFSHVTPPPLVTLSWR